ncbi:MAG: amidohydrolase family protein, partial [Ferruginibacter sp.]
YYYEGKISLEKIAEKMSHAVAECFKIKDRGYIREGYFADLVVVDLKKSLTISKENILYKCGWSPLENFKSAASIVQTMVNGHIVYGNGAVIESALGKRLGFNR